jgi:glycosyltransferase involved in cell wall biosynthesis
MTKKVGFGTTLLDKGLSGTGIDGIGQYCLELIKQFKGESDDLEISPYSFGVVNSQSNAHVLPSYPAHLFESMLNIRKYSTSQKYFETVDLIHCTDQLIPVVPNKLLVATVMDTIPLSHPEFIKTRSRFIKPLLWKKLTARANHIITISEFSKSEIINLMGFPEERVTSIPLGVDERFFSRIPEKEIHEILKRLNIFKPFFLFLGSIQPRKNLLNMIQAHSTLPNDLATQFPLVIAGKVAWDDGQTLAAIQQGVLENRCIWLNYVSDMEKRALLQATQGLVFASLYEGFGLPIIEAFASQAPVITSNCTSMPEVAGNAALIVDPLNIESITSALIHLIEDADKRERLKALGLEKAKKYTWEQVARATKAVYLGF